MITGDNHSTAIAVAKDVGMIKPDADILLIDAVPQIEAPPTQLSAAEQDAAGLQPLVSTPSAKIRVHFDIDEQQGPADEGLSASAPAGERQTPAALIDEGQSPAALSREGLASAALHGERHHLADLGSEKQISEGLTGQQHGQRQGQLSTALNDKGQQPSGLIHTQQAPTAPDAVAAAPATSCSSSAGATQISSLQYGSLPKPLASILEPQSSTAQPLPSSADPTEGLSLTGHQGQRSYSAAQALTAMAEGHLQCAVTSAAFDHLLQHATISVIQTVMRTAVVFARMKPHQKGQVMGLLGSAGLHHAFQGQSRHLLVGMHLCMSCMSKTQFICNHVVFVYC